MSVPSAKNLGNKGPVNPPIFMTMQTHRLTISWSCGRISRGKQYVINSLKDISVNELNTGGGLALNGKIYGIIMQPGSKIDIRLDPEKCPHMIDDEYQISVKINPDGSASISNNESTIIRSIPDNKLFTVGRYHKNNYQVFTHLYKWSRNHLELFWDRKSNTLYIGEPDQLPTNGVFISTESTEEVAQAKVTAKILNAMKAAARIINPFSKD